MARKSRTKADKPVNSYAHTDAERVNNPPVGLVTAGTDPDAGHRSYNHRAAGAWTASHAGSTEPDAHGGVISAGSGLAGDDASAGGVGESTGSGWGAAGVRYVDIQSKSIPDPSEQADDSGLGAADSLDDAVTPYGPFVADDPHLEPEMVWAGKAERGRFEVPTVSLHVHERIDPRTIIDAIRRRPAGSGGNTQGSMFELPGENPPLRQAIEFYRHAHNWTNRLIAGDSLLVMNSLLAKENLAGKVGMVYVDPPYGVKYGSNFQPFTHRREVSDGKDTDLSREPETIRAFRDTWELGIHSYLSYLRDRLALTRELLAETGSCFVQIGDENVHRVGLLCDEVFGAENRMATITYATTSGSSTKHLPQVGDYLLWYAKDKARAKYRQLYEQLDRAGIVELFTPYAAMVELPDGTARRLTPEERFDPDEHLPERARLFSVMPLQSQGWSNTGRSKDYTWRGHTYFCADTLHWRVSHEGLDRLARRNRLYSFGAHASLRWKWFEDEVPGRRINNLWHRQMPARNKTYVVQTANSVIQRCLLMTTDPGDLVFDPTCGSGTTAYVAEQWGRRWITCDTSRVALALARQRLMTAGFDYYALAHRDEGVAGGFVYHSVRKVSAASLAYDHPPQETTLYDRPEVDETRHRVTGPFTVEAVPAPTVISPDDDFAPLDPATSDSPDTTRRHHAPASHPGRDSESPQTDRDVGNTGSPATVAAHKPVQPDGSVARSGETARHRRWLDELITAGIRGRRGARISFTRLEPLPSPHIHASGEADSAEWEAPRRAAVVFGPEHAPLDPRRVEPAVTEAQRLVPRPELLVFAAFAFDPEAAKDIEEILWPGTELLRAEMNSDLHTADLRKKATANESFWLVGQPEVMVDVDGDGRYRVEVLGFDYFDIDSGEHLFGDADDIAVWMLDTDYDGRSLFPSQVFFPSDGPKGGWTRLAKTLRAEIATEAMSNHTGVESLPFDAGDHNRVAVKITDTRGIESLRVLDLPPLSDLS